MTTPLRSSRGQALLECALVLPVLLMLCLGVVEVGYALYDAHVVSRLTREGSNLISRDTTLSDAVQAMRSISAPPVNFDDGSSTVIFSVIKQGTTKGTSNYGRPILYQRYSYGTYPAHSGLSTVGAGSFTGDDYTAANSDSDTNLQVTNLPPGTMPPGGIIYITEIYSRHALITPVDRFGIAVPTTLYSIAYF